MRLHTTRMSVNDSCYLSDEKAYLRSCTPWRLFDSGMHDTWGRFAGKVLQDGVHKFGKGTDFGFAVRGYCLANGQDVLLQPLYLLVKGCIIV